MKSVLVIGIGRFGLHTSQKFAELGNDVMAIDTDEERIREILPHVLNAQIGDCTQEEVINSLGVRNFDVCVVAITDLGTSLEITYLLKEYGAPFILSRANSEMHAKILLRAGADEITYPEKQMAERIAVKHTANNLFDFFEISPEYSMSELSTPADWIGKTVEAVNVRTKHHINILAYKTNNGAVNTVGADYTFNENEHLFVFGKSEDIIKFANKVL